MPISYQSDTSPMYVGRLDPMAFMAFAYPASSQIIDGETSTVLPAVDFDYPIRSITLTGGYPGGMVTAWSGAAYRYDTDKMILNGGGHADYSGNDVLEFDSATGVYTLLRSASTDFTGYTAAAPLRIMADGSRPSVHSYQGLAHIGGSTMYAMGGSLASNAGTVDQSRWTFDLTTKVWDDQVIDTNTGPGLGCYLFWDTGLSTLYLVRTGILHTINTSTGALTKLIPADSGYSAGFTYGISYDPVRQVMVAIGQIDFALGTGTPIMRTYNTSTGVSTIQATPILDAYAAGAEYVADIDRHVFWAGGNTLYFVHPVDFTITTQIVGGITLPDKTETGMYGRFRWSSTLQRFIIVVDLQDTAYYIEYSGA